MSVPVGVGEARRDRDGRGGEPSASSRAVTGGRLRFCLSGGAGLKREVKELFHRAGVLHHRGLRPDRDLADADPQPPRRVPLRHRGQAPALASSSSSRRTARSSRAGRACSPATTRTRRRRRRRSPRTAGSRPATSAASPTTASCRSSIARRTSSSRRAARTSRPRTSRCSFGDDPFIEHVVVYGDGKNVPGRGRVAEPRGGGAHLEAQGVATEAWPEAMRALVQERIARVNAELARHETIKAFLVDEPLAVESGLLDADAQGAAQEGVRALRARRSRRCTHHEGPRHILARAWAEAPPKVGQTPADVVHSENKWRLLRYRPRPEGPPSARPCCSCRR